MTTRTVPGETRAGYRHFAVPVAALLGLAGGLLFGDAALAFAARVWNGVILPAYLEVQKSGIPFCS